MPYVRFSVLLAGIVLSMMLAFALDRVVFNLLAPNEYWRDHFQNTDLYKLLRVGGFFGTWLGVAAMLILVDWSKRSRGMKQVTERAILLIMSGALAGLIRATGKILFRRLRPDPYEPYVFWDWRPFTDQPFYGGGLSLPSEHTSVAFAAAMMMSYLFPRASQIWFIWACGTALTRLAQSAHYFSDTVAGAWVGVLSAMTIICWHHANQRAGHIIRPWQMFLSRDEPLATAAAPPPVATAASPEHSPPAGYRPDSSARPGHASDQTAAPARRCPD